MTAERYFDTSRTTKPATQTWILNYTVVETSNAENSRFEKEDRILQTKFGIETSDLQTRIVKPGLLSLFCG